MLEYYRFKEINDLFQKGRNEEARHLLMEMQARYIAMCDENSFLKMQVHELEDVLYLAKNLSFDGSCYWLLTGGIKQGPFCQRCYNQDGALLRLDTQNGEWICPACGMVHDHLYPDRFETALARRAPRPAKIIPFSR